MDREVIGAGLGATLMISCSVEVIIINIINMVLKNKDGWGQLNFSGTGKNRPFAL